MNNNTERLPESPKPDLNSQAYRKLLQTVHKETHGLHLLSLVDIVTGQIYVLPDEAAIEQATFACSLFGGASTGTLNSIDAVENRELVSFQIGACQIMSLPVEQGSSSLTVIAFSDHQEVNKLRQIMAEAQRGQVSDSLAGSLGNNRQVLRAWKFNVDSASLIERYERAGTEKNRIFAELDALDPAHDLLPLIKSLDSGASSNDRPWLKGALVVSSGKVLRWLRIPFIPDHILFADAPERADDQLIIAGLIRAQNDLQRQLIAELLESGLETRVEPFPESSLEFAEIVRNLRNLDKSDLRGRLVEGGFANHPQTVNDTHMRCQECIYFLPNRRWCDLPELPVPVEPDWFCRLWKI